MSDPKIIKIAVVIPYYQRGKGILRQALLSIAAQRTNFHLLVHVIIVDDASPVPARGEIPDPLPAWMKVEILSQPNGGCASARNRALDSVPGDAEFIAFLDSDDIWRPSHIDYALRALGQGSDLYFCDHERKGLHKSHFEMIGFPDGAVSSENLQSIGDSLWNIPKDPFFKFFFRSFTAQISTVMYRKSIFPEGRFNNKLRSAGEDYLFLLQLTSASKKVAFSTHNHVLCGDGVNVYNSLYSWEDEGHLRRIMADLLSDAELGQGLQLEPPEAVNLVDRIRSGRREFAYAALRWALKGGPSWSPELKRLAAADATFSRWFLPSVLYVGVMKPLRLYSPVPKAK